MTTRVGRAGPPCVSVAGEDFPGRVYSVVRHPMWLLYLLALVLGGGLLLVQLFGGAHHGVDHAVGGDHLGGSDHPPSSGPSVLSVRSVTYGLFAFGFVGTSLNVLGLAAPLAALAVAGAAGVATTLAVGTTLRAVGDPAASGEAALGEARG